MYSWLWNKEPADAYEEFMRGGNRVLSDFVEKLQSVAAVTTALPSLKRQQVFHILAEH